MGELTLAAAMLRGAAKAIKKTSPESWPNGRKAVVEEGGSRDYKGTGVDSIIS